MRTKLHAVSGRLTLLAFCACIGLAMLGHAQSIDLNGDGVSDIWALVYKAGGLNPNAIVAGGGLTVRQASIAGINPFDPKASIAVSIAAASGSNITLTWPSVAGKGYKVQSSLLLASGTWSDETAILPGTGSPMSSTLPKALAAKFFRVVISDVDTNGDGLNDWEALQLGLDPANAYSNARVDGNGQPISDYSYVTTALTATNVVSIAATKTGATVPDSGAATDTGTFTITRSGNLNAITVPLSLTGSAVEGRDFATVSHSVTFPIGASTEQITVSPLAASALQSGAPVKMTLQSGSGYNLGTQSDATVVIYPSSTPAGSGVFGQYWSNSNSTYSSSSNFSGSTISRLDPTIDFYWGKGQPYAAVNRNNFSATWEGQLAPPTTGTYLFGLQAQEGARLYVNNQLVIDAWAAGSSTATMMQSAPVALVTGTLYPIRVEYYKLSSAASIYLTWLTPGATTFLRIPSTNTIYRPDTSGSTGWLATYYNTATLSGSAAMTIYETGVYENWGTGSPDPSFDTTSYSARWTGQVQPEFTEPYTFVAHTSQGAKLWVSGTLIIDNWKNQGGAVDVSSTSINLQAGARYDLKMEYFQSTGAAEAHLSWNSPSQVQEVIPMSRLYPASLPAAPTAVTSPTSAVALVGGTFSYAVSASNSPSGYTVTGLPSGLTFNAGTGLISGVISQAGAYEIVITATNAAGAGSSTLTLNALTAGGAITREIWTGVSGTTVSSIPVNATPSITGTLTSLEGITGYGSNYGERLRGYITAPVTGNYYFWISGSSSAELWIADDSEPVNRVKRAAVTVGTAPRAWSVSPGQQSPWLALTAGQQYYIEVLHKAGTGGGDNVAVGWLRPDQSGSTASEVVPGYALSPYSQTSSTSSAGTLYTAIMLAEGTASTDGVGTASLRLSGTQAVVSLSYAGLTSTVTAVHIDSDPYLANPGGQILFDIAAAHPQPDGTYLWTIKPAGTLAVSDILELLSEGKAYLNIQTAKFPDGEIRGNFTLADGSQTFTAPPAPPSWSDDHTTDAGASRFLTQATFGPSPADIATVETTGYSAWIDNQFATPATHHLPFVLAHPYFNPSVNYEENASFDSWWQQSVTAPDQLRQRVAFALSEIMVISAFGVLNDHGLALSSYYDMLLDNAFGNYRDLIENVTLAPAMGLYLDMQGNDKGNQATGLHADENYAREVMQLFSIGLNRMWPDGTAVEDSKGNIVPTYDQDVIEGMAAVLTGWNYNQPLQSGGRLPTDWTPSADYVDPMVLVPTHHDLGPKRILDNVVLPPATGSQADSTNPAFDAYCSNDLEAAMDSLYNNPNVGPFICRQLIQRLVTSNPSRDYLYRVTQVFNDNGSGVRGDMKAVIKAILLDYQARSSTAATDITYGKLREPVLRVTAPARYFPSSVGFSGSYSQSGSKTILITATSPHRLSNGDTVALNFTSGTPLPTSDGYTVSGVSGSNATTFTVTSEETTGGTYTQSGNVISISLTHGGLAPGDPVYLAFTTAGGPANGIYPVTAVADTTHFTAAANDSAMRSGSCAIGRYTAGYNVTSGTMTVTTVSVNHGLNPGDPVLIKFSAGTAVSGTFTVISVPDLIHFTVPGSGLGNQTEGHTEVYPLKAPPLNRSGAVAAQTSTWGLEYTDADLGQTPLNSPTVFNFFFPGFKFPGALASAGLTTPEFQLTSDSTVMLQTNFLEAGVLASGNTNGLASFRGGDSSVVMDMGPYLSMTSDGAIPALVDLFNNQMMGGSLSADSRNAIISYVANTANFPYGSPPTSTQQRDRVRAVVHLIITSPEFSIQK